MGRRPSKLAKALEQTKEAAKAADESAKEVAKADKGKEDAPKADPTKKEAKADKAKADLKKLQKDVADRTDKVQGHPTPRHPQRTPPRPLEKGDLPKAIEAPEGRPRQTRGSRREGRQGRLRPRVIRAMNPRATRGDEPKGDKADKPKGDKGDEPQGRQGRQGS